MGPDPNDRGRRGEPLLVVQDLAKTYGGRNRLSRARQPAITAVQGINLTLGRGRTLGIVGGSGAGKSTLARCIACLDTPDSGRIVLEGQDLTALPSRAHLRRARRSVQLVLQGSAASLNPRFSALDVVTEPALISGAQSRDERRRSALAMMELVGLPASAANRLCTEFSGGERQRLAIARALTVSPKVFILDESLSGLDRPLQAQLLNLLLDLQERLGFACIFISHDLRLTAHVSDNVAVMYIGQIVDYGPSGQVVRSPSHSHTKALLAAAAGFNLVG